MYVTREDIRKAAGRLVLCGFDGIQVTPELKEILREVVPAGLILFARNVVSPEQVAELNCELKSLRRQEPLLLAVDQEGGRVARIREGATVWPPMRMLGRVGDTSLALRLGRALAAELRAMSFDVDLAPVLDVDTNPQNPVIGDRALSHDPETVATLGAAIVKGLQDNGVGACGKHFPGHGDTAQDSHTALPHVVHDLPRLRRIEWLPFGRAIDAGVGAIMTAHVVVEALDDQRPATLSPGALAPLRDELGFRGVVLSDDLEMKAVADHFRPDEMAVLGLKAGVDAFLACHLPEVILALFRGIVVGVESGAISKDTLLAAEGRVTAWRQRYYSGPAHPSLLHRFVACPEHLALAEEIHARAAALV